MTEGNQGYLEQEIISGSPQKAQNLRILEQEKKAQDKQSPGVASVIRKPFLQPDPQRQTKDFVENHGGFIKRRKKKHTGKAIHERQSTTEIAQQTTLQAKRRLEKFEEEEAFLKNAFNEDEMEQLEKEENDLSNFGIKEYGINESMLTPEQSNLLCRVRTFAQKASKAYRKAMHELMKTYQSYNPQFTDAIKQKMMERGYDLPQFYIYGAEAARQFLSQQRKFENVSFDENSFLINFNLPRPIARFWYRGGNGWQSEKVESGAIEWGDFYRNTMPVIWNAVDQAEYAGDLFLSRINGVSNHDPKNYYYLWKAVRGSNNPTFETG